ncbi:MAG: LysM peptidoglycan-binding domain-containing protein [Treponema sp.]|jgi:membrane-bound lytic murein transglycosylase D|nr:LysM peptidoglycan-binding domain-containing protein [Treponema sp.]
MRACGFALKTSVFPGLLFYFLIINYSLASAQTVSDRPLRAVVSEAVPAALSAQKPKAHPSSIITAKALEQPLTRRYIARYSSASGLAWLNAALERGSVYLPYIKKEVERMNLPPELAYLPVIESDFQITARSGSGAVGLWQFMMNSIAPFNIKVNDYVDERRDFEKSTSGALRKLNDNYETLGNWELALAAYNSGLGAVTRTVQITKNRDYWELSKQNELRAETIQYVPKLIAVSYIISEPRRFGVDCWQPLIYHESIPLPRQVSLDLLAEKADIDIEILNRLNAELLQGISPADKNYRLKVPASGAAKVRELLSQEDELVNYHLHIVKHGDTLWAISRHYEVSLEIINRNNPGISGSLIKPGDIIRIPSRKNIPPASPVLPEPVFFEGNYVVQKGDTLWSLSRKYNTDPETLAVANNMEINQILNEGKVLKVPKIE